MSKYEEIKKQIDLLSDEEIESFVINRLNELDSVTEEQTIGQGYTDTYNGYIGSKTHYKAMASTENIKCPDLVYDYYEPYIDLIKNIRGKNRNELTLLNEVFNIINQYSPLGYAIEFERGLVYASALSRKEPVSIKTILSDNCAYCSERSGLAQNMFKILGIDTDLVTGYIDDERHAYNIVYPNGYGIEPMFLFDSSHFVNFNSNDHKYSLAYFYGMNKAKYDKLMSGEPYKIELSKTENYYRSLFGFGSEFEFVANEPNYIVGLDNNPKIANEIDIDEWLYNAHQENGVESVEHKTL